MNGLGHKSINKLMRTWHDQSIVTLWRGRVTILDTERLQRLVDPMLR